jgi:hypothetical protein
MLPSSTGVENIKGLGRGVKGVDAAAQRIPSTVEKANIEN